MKEAYKKYLDVFQQKYMREGHSAEDARKMAKKEAYEAAKIIYAENRNPNILPATEANNSQYPPRTANAQMEAQYVAAVAEQVFCNAYGDKKGAGMYPSITVFTHEDGTVSVGFSGNVDAKKYDFEHDAKLLQEALNARIGTSYGNTNYIVASKPVAGVIYEPPGGCPRGVCSEPKAAAAAASKKTYSLITGMDTVWHGAWQMKEEYKYSGTDIIENLPIYFERMDPCKTCGYPSNVEVYMKGANAAKK